MKGAAGVRRRIPIMSKPIENYALIEDLESAAMVAQDGAIDGVRSAGACAVAVAGPDSFWMCADHNGHGAGRPH